MVASHNSEVINQDRHRLLSSAATGIAVAGIVSLFPPRARWRRREFCNPPDPRQRSGSRPYRSPPAHYRHAFSDWETVDYGSQGVQFATFRELMPTGARTTTGEKPRPGSAPFRNSRR
jgi:hypothetical protein